MYEIRLNSARNALRYLIRVYKIKELFIPYYICPSIRQAILKENTKIKFYHIDENFFPIINFKNDDFILYPNYFGICAKNVIKLSKNYKNLIIDNANAFFMKQDLGLASFVSLRKFFNLPDGSILYCKDKLNETFKTAKDRNFPDNNTDFILNEKFLDSANIEYMSVKTSNNFDMLNLNSEKQIRILRFNELHKELFMHNSLKISITNNDIPYMYPYLINKEDFKESEIREILKNFEVLRFWNNLPKNFLEYNFYMYLMAIKI